MKSHKASYNRWSDLFFLRTFVSHKEFAKTEYFCVLGVEWTNEPSPPQLKRILKLLDQILCTLTVLNGIRWEPSLFRLCIYTAWWTLTSRNVQILAGETSFCLLTAAAILSAKNSFFTSVSKITLDIFTDTKRSLHRLCHYGARLIPKTNRQTNNAMLSHFFTWDICMDKGRSISTGRVNQHCSHTVRTRCL